MFVKSMSSLFNEVLFSQCRYKVLSMSYENKYPVVNCEIIKTGDLLHMDLIDIINNDKLKFFSTHDVLILSKNFEKIDQLPVINTEKETKYYNIISTMFTVCLLMSNVAELKICDFFGYSIGAGTLIFPLVYILNDILTEVYGFSCSRKAIWQALFINCIFSTFLYFITILPPSEHWGEQESFEKLFFVSPRIVIASLLSYLVGEMINATIISSLKIKFSGRYFVVRAIFSTFVGSLIESVIFGYIAFYGRIPNDSLVEMITLLTIIKLLYETLAMPITIKIVCFLKQAEKIDSYEKPLLANIFPKIFI